MGTVAWTMVAHLALTSSQRDTQGCHHVHLYGRGATARRNPPDAPLSSELQHCTAYPDFRPEATWAQPLGPGRAVLTGGVSRRSGSVACVRTDASPNEVLARKCCTPARGKSTSTFDNCQSLTNPLCHCPRRYCVQTGVVLCAHAATSRLNEQIVDVAPRPAVVPVQGCRLRGDVRPLSTST